MTYNTILFDLADGVATITLNRPDMLNAISTEMVTEIADAAGRVEAGAARCLLITGAGKGFCAGADLGGGDINPEMIQNADFDAGLQLEQHFNPLVRQLNALPVPVVSAVNGVAAGAGCSLALTADFVVASERAYFLQAFINIGLVPDAGSTWVLPRLVGRARATQMMMLGDRVPAAQALDWGMIHSVASENDLMPSARKLAARLAAGPRRSYHLLRQSIQSALDSTLDETLERERAFQREAGRTAEFREGVRAFSEKRKPAFDTL
jgi:2-(1,2-epoxy-1,2-dihydrophenyl)acetyl-CoA isomerase